MTNVTGKCSQGFFCTRGANSSAPTDGTTGKGVGYAPNNWEMGPTSSALCLGNFMEVESTYCGLGLTH